MSAKTFYGKFKAQNFLEKKYLNSLINSKNIIRNNIGDKGDVYSIDNNSNVTHFKTKETIEVGSSVMLNDFVFKNKYNKQLELKTFQNTFTNVNEINSLNLDKSLKTISNEKSSLRLMIFLDGVKGGFLGYSSGIVGFIPKSQIRNIIQNIIKNHSNKKINISNLLFLLSKNHFTKRYFPFRVPFFLSNMAVYPSFQKYNFSKSTQRKRRSFRNYLNFIFISKKVVQKSKSYKILNKNEKFKYQKNSKPYYSKENTGKKVLPSFRK